jgi:uncharacterized membrane protein
MGIKGKNINFYPAVNSAGFVFALSPLPDSTDKNYLVSIAIGWVEVEHTISMAVRFVVYGTIGWVLEVLWTGLGSLLAGDPRLRSQTYLWMFPIYGAAVLLEGVHDYIRNWHWLARGLIYMTIIFAVEYSTGWLIRDIVGTAPWVYTNRFAIDNLIRLDYAPVWFVVGFLFERVHDFLDERLISL